MLSIKIPARAFLLSLFCAFAVASFSPVEAKKILAKVGSSEFTQVNSTELVELAEFLAGSNLSTSDKEALQIWAIDDFKAAPKVSAGFYKSLSNDMLPRIRKNGFNGTYGAELYLSYVDVFARHPEYKKSPNNFLAIIDRYKPPVQESLQIRQIRNNLVLQQMQMNQRLFNRNMTQFQNSTNTISKSIEDQSTRNSITLPGGKILHETDGRIYAEDYKGEKFEVMK